ncbi:PREDICTED: LOC110665661 isoform [Prunus dulcis]|uniref:PREDICTED: LOC110665661 isoform n=1 Tax=Prunus dulcis TaxID=3755 RepID=A0A5E4FMQ1_PRUDU|nr:PREDICTED: LOC110665661 isoform [Prunus dulcis]
MMRRQGQYGDSGVNTYAAAAPMHHMSGQRMEHKSSHFEGRLEAFTPERDNPYASSKSEGQWRWERDGSKGSNPMASHMYNEGKWGDTSRSYFQGQRPDPKLAMEKQNNNDSRSQSHNEDMDLGYEDKPSSQAFEELEQKFLGDIRKLTKEQNDAEDAENARHKEKIGAINAQYEEQLVALRARHASRRDELLRRESNARQHQYQQSVMDRYPNSSMGPSELRGYSGVAASAAGGEGHRAYNTDQYESYRERARFLGGSRDHGFEPRGPYPGGRVYDTGSRYY